MTKPLSTAELQAIAVTIIPAMSPRQTLREQMDMVIDRYKADPTVYVGSHPMPSGMDTYRLNILSKKTVGEHTALLDEFKKRFKHGAIPKDDAQARSFYGLYKAVSISMADTQAIAAGKKEELTPAGTAQPLEAQKANIAAKKARLAAPSHG